MKNLLLIFFLIFTTITFSQVNRAGGGTVEPGTVVALTASATLNLDNGMTADSMSALIAAQAQNLGGYRLTIQFADGNYSLDNTVFIKHFYNGTVWVSGNSSDNTNSKTKSVNFDFTEAGFGFKFEQLEADLLFRYIKVNNTTTACILFEKCNTTYVQYCYFLGDNNTNCIGIQCNVEDLIRVLDCTFGYGLYGIYHHGGGQSYVKDNTDGLIADIPEYGQVVEGVSVMRISGTSITGNISNNSQIDGGTIR